MKIKLITAGLLLSMSTVYATSKVEVIDDPCTSCGESHILPASTINPHIQFIALETKKLAEEKDHSVLASKALDLIAVTATPYKGKLPTEITSIERHLLTSSIFKLVQYLHGHKTIEKERLVNFIEARAKTVKTEEQDYISYLATTLLGSFEHCSTPTSARICQTSVIDEKFPEWLREKLTADDSWKHFHPYSQYLRMTEMSDLLSQTDSHVKAHEISQLLNEYLKKHTDFSMFPTDFFSDERSKETLTALIKLEQFKMFETEQGSLKTVDPTIMDYYDASQTSFKSQAILLSLASAIQHNLYNPRTSPTDLIRLLRYQKNDRRLSVEVRNEIKNLFEDGSVSTLITDQLVEQIQRVSLIIASTQRIQIEKEAAKQRTSSYRLPVLSLTSTTIESAPLSMQYFGSSGDGLQCGFFSLGFASRRQAIEQILDNLAEDDIYILADKVSVESSAVRQALKKLFNDSQDSPAAQRYLALYAKRRGVDPREASTLEQLKTEYQALAKEMTDKEALIDQDFEDLKKEKGLPSRFPETDDGTIAAQFSLLRKPFEHRKWAELSKFSKLIYPLADFQQFIEKDITAKFLSGELEFDPNPEWKSDVFTYPKIIATLNNYDIYCWVSESSFRMMRMQAGGWIADPIYKTPDGRFILVDFVSGGSNAKRVDILNLGGGHFEKWVSETDIPRLARSIRHKTAYRLSDTAPSLSVPSSQLALLSLLHNLKALGF